METIIEQFQAPTVFGQWVTYATLPAAPRSDRYSEFVCCRLLRQTKFFAFCFEFVLAYFRHADNISCEYPGEYSRRDVTFSLLLQTKAASFWLTA